MSDASTALAEIRTILGAHAYFAALPIVSVEDRDYNDQVAEIMDNLGACLLALEPQPDPETFVTGRALVATRIGLVYQSAESVRRRSGILDKTPDQTMTELMRAITTAQRNRSNWIEIAEGPRPVRDQNSGEIYRLIVLRHKSILTAST
ncbi:MAG: hypothetical protein ABQ298_03755 [Puniceicoccaceae bacterium]